MCPERANIFLVEDKPELLKLKKLLLTRGGHHVVAEATTPDEVNAEIPLLEKKGVNVAVLDANLSPGAVDGKEGVEFAKKIRELALEIGIVGMSSNAFPQEAHVDIDVGGSSPQYFSVSKVIDAL